MGGFFTTVEEFEDTYCETCGDSDWLHGRFETKEELVDYLRDYIHFCNSGGYSVEYLEEIVALSGLEDEYDEC